MGLTTEERLCFQKALDVLDATALAIASAHSAPEVAHSRDDGFAGLASPSHRNMSQQAPIATSCQQVEDLLRLCLDLLLVDGDVQRLLVLLEDDRLMCVLRRLLTTNPGALVAPSPSSSNGFFQNHHHHAAMLLDDATAAVSTPNRLPTASHDVSAFTPIAFSMLQANLFCIARDVLVAVSAAPAAIALVAPLLRREQWIDVLLRYLGLKKHRSSVEGTLLEAIYVLSHILIDDAAGTSSNGNDGNSDEQGGGTAALVGGAELALVLGRIQNCFHDVSIRNFAMGTVRLWVLGRTDGSNNNNGLLASRDVIVARESVGAVMVWIFTTSGASEALRSGDPLPAQVRFTLSTAAEVLSSFVLVDPSVLLPQCVQRHASRLLDALLLLHKQLHADPAMLAGRDARRGRAGTGSGSESMLLQQSTHVSMAIEVLVLDVAVMTRVVSIKQWLLAVLLLLSNNSSSNRFGSEHQSDGADANAETGASQQTQKQLQRRVCSGITACCARWLRFSAESFVAAGRFDELLNAVHEPSLLIRQTEGSANVLLSRVGEDAGDDVYFHIRGGSDHLEHTADPTAVASLWTLLSTMVREGATSKPSPQLAEGTQALSGLQTSAHQEASLMVGVLLVAGTRCPSRRALLCEMVEGPIAVVLLTVLHALFLHDGHRGASIVRLHGSDGELLNSTRFVAALGEHDDVSDGNVSTQVGAVWNQPAALYDIVQFIVCPERVDTLNETLEVLQSSSAQRHQQSKRQQHLSRAEWIERHHKLAVALFSISILGFASN